MPNTVTTQLSRLEPNLKPIPDNQYQLDIDINEIKFKRFDFGELLEFCEDKFEEPYILYDLDKGRRIIITGDEDSEFVREAKIINSGLMDTYRFNVMPLKNTLSRLVVSINYLRIKQKTAYPGLSPKRTVITFDIPFIEIEPSNIIG
ncbi:MAG: hypothetical protein WD335_01205 [Candidatus Paceibacterota bacterium]